MMIIMIINLQKNGVVVSPSHSPWLRERFPSAVECDCADGNDAGGTRNLLLDLDLVRNLWCVNVARVLHVRACSRNDAEMLVMAEVCANRHSRCWRLGKLMNWVYCELLVIQHQVVNPHWLVSETRAVTLAMSLAPEYLTVRFHFGLILMTTVLFHFFAEPLSNLSTTSTIIINYKRLFKTNVQNLHMIPTLTDD